MQNMVWKLAFIGIVVAFCLLSIFGQELRLGTDLRGGVSLIYQVTVGDSPLNNPEEVVRQTITVLKDRVNPTGVLDISMQPLGRDRIEIVMPLPNEVVQGLAREYQIQLSELLARSEISAGSLDDALRRGAAGAEMGGDAESIRGRSVNELQTAYDARAAAREAMENARAQNAGADELKRREFEVAAAEIAFEDLYDKVLKLSLGESRVRRTLALPTTPQELKGPDGKRLLDEQGKQVLGPSQRENAIATLKSEFSHLADALDRTVAAYDTYQGERTGFDDPEDLIRLLRGAGVLDFRIAVSATSPEGVDIADMRRQLAEVGPENSVSQTAGWFPINEIKQWYDQPAQLAELEADPISYFQRRDLAAGVFEGEHFLLLYKTRPRSLTHESDRPDWAITQTYPGADTLGRPAVTFILDSAGGGLMGRLTGANIGEPMAIVLDGEIYSAPVIQSTISTNGQITGNFSQEEIEYLMRVLAAGSLQARLSTDPIAMSTLGPSIGQDNLVRGKEAFVIALIAVAAFMVVYYFFAGVVAVVALAINGIMIFGVMMGIDGTFTLPGLAGIVLTIGMAVDANVLIYERIREEIVAGELDLRGAVRQGYGKALSTILDSNITNLIVCLVLFRTATTEVKGFALTLTIGICATLFTQLFITRQLFYLYTDGLKIKKLPMLATVVPAIHRALEPNIDWIGLRKIFGTISAIAVVASVILVVGRGEDLFDTEFRGGVSLTMRTAIVDEDGDGQPDAIVDGEPQRLMLRQSGDPRAVEDRIRKLGSDAAAALAAGGAGLDDDQRNRLRVLSQLEDASILTAGASGADADGNTIAQAFQVKVANPKGLDEESLTTSVVVDAIVDAFETELDVTPPVTYAGIDVADPSAYVFPIKGDQIELGQSINRPDATDRIPDFLGGAAILLTQVDPPITEAGLETRIDRMRNQPDFVKYSARNVKAFGLKLADPARPELGYTELALVVYDPFRSYLKTDTEVWFDEVATTEWALVGAALKKPTSLEQVSTFSSAVAETLAAQAVVAVFLSLLGILIYIWVRFGSLRYSVAAVVALMHDVTIALGFLALSTLIGGTAIASALLIEPFRINLGVVAALLTVIGYSLNDTIVILDRIRENRGKLPLPTAKIVNNAINQTFSRTTLTSGTTLLAIVIMYAEGGSGIRSFTFCLFVGLIVGTYSSVAIAAPLVYTRTGGTKKAPAAPAETADQSADSLLAGSA